MKMVECILKGKLFSRKSDCAKHFQAVTNRSANIMKSLLKYLNAAKNDDIVWLEREKETDEIIVKQKNPM